MRKRIKNYWEGEAALYCNSFPIEQIYTPIVNNWANVILKQYNYVGKPVDILELGSGTGCLLLALSKTENNVTGIDISNRMINITKDRIKKAGALAKTMQMDAELLLYEDDSFDIIIGDNLLWTLSNPFEAYKEWYRVLKPNGKIFIFDANWNLWRFDKELYKKYQEYQKYLIYKYKRGTHIYCNQVEGEEIDKILYLSDKKRPEWDINAMKQIGYRNVYTWMDVSSLVWDKTTLEYNKQTLPFMVCGEK